MQSEDEIVHAVEEVMKNGRKAIKGVCPTCGTVMFKILGGKASPPAEPSSPGSVPPILRRPRLTDTVDPI